MKKKRAASGGLGQLLIPLVALGILIVFNLFRDISFFSIGMRVNNSGNIVLTGNLSGVSQAGPIFDTLNRMFNLNFMIPENSRFGTVIGAALAGCEDNRTEFTESL